MNTVGGSVNQLDRLVEASVLAGLPDNRADIPFTPSYRDASIGLEIRAKAYLDANCAHCHALGRSANTSGGLNYDIVAGHPEQSIIVFRMNSVDPGAVMPELGRSLIDAEGVRLILDYITDLEN